MYRRTNTAAAWRTRRRTSLRVRIPCAGHTYATGRIDRRPHRRAKSFATLALRVSGRFPFECGVSVYGEEWSACHFAVTRGNRQRRSRRRLGPGEGAEPGKSPSKRFRVRISWRTVRVSDLSGRRFSITLRTARFTIRPNRYPGPDQGAAEFGRGRPDCGQCTRQQTSIGRHVPGKLRSGSWNLRLQRDCAGASQRTDVRRNDHFRSEVAMANCFGKNLVPAVAGMFCALAANAQSFEVVSVRQRIVPAGEVVRRPHFSSGAIVCGNPVATELFDCGISGTRFSDAPASLLDLIIDAYNVRENAIFGLPDWGDSGHDLYDVSARVGGDLTPTLDQVRRMLQTLLADRFQLKIHHETKEFPVYDLVVAKKPRLFKSATACGVNSESPSTDDLVPVPSRWEQIPSSLSRNADRPVIDKTGFEADARYCVPGKIPDPALLLMRTFHPPLPATPTPRDEIANALNRYGGHVGIEADTAQRANGCSGCRSCRTPFDELRQICVLRLLR